MTHPPPLYRAQLVAACHLSPVKRRFSFFYAPGSQSSSPYTGNNHHVVLAICPSDNWGIFHGRTMGILTVFPLPSPCKETDNSRTGEKKFFVRWRLGVTARLAIKKAPSIRSPFC